MTTILSVAEKPSVAKELANILSSNHNPNRINGRSPYNHIWDVGAVKFRNQPATMKITSVSGHTMDLDFTPEHKGWHTCNPIDLFDAPVVNSIKPGAQDMCRTLKEEAKKANTLLLWLDCDLEGENIAFEVIQICKESNPNLDIWRARFSALIPRDILRTMNFPERPSIAMNDAVEARKEIDLRLGAAFTRFQTLQIQNKYNGIGDGVISYGPCQFPTLGFVIERHLRMEAFHEESFWKLDLSYNGPDPDEPSGVMECHFTWDRVRLFDRLSTLVLYEMCLDFSPLVLPNNNSNTGGNGNIQATVIRCDTRPTSRWRPVPLNTVELQKRSSRYLHLSSARTMEVAEGM